MRWLQGLAFCALPLLLVVVSGCPAPPPAPMSPHTVEGVDFLARDLLLDLSWGEENTNQAFREWVLGRGWGQPGAEGAWGLDRSAILEASVAPEVDRLWIEGAAYRGIEGPLTVGVVVDGLEVGVIKPGVKTRWYDFPLPSRGAERALVTVELRFSGSRSPKEAGLGNDPRSLAFFVRQIAFVAGSQAPDTIDRRAPIEETPEGLRVNRAGRVLYNLGIDTRYTAVEVAMHMGRSSGETARVSVWQPESSDCVADGLFDKEVQATGLLRLDVDPNQVPLQVAVDVQGPVANLTVKAHPAAQGGRDVMETTSTRRAGGDLPDIFVFVLDASRVDHFGRAYGYERDTVPTIDRMAREALVFTQVVAQAPYTSCSVPTMFTGLGYSTHQVVGTKDRLSDEEQTLAESLKAAGYQTIGLSATPNNSAQLGMAQGYDDFIELWQGTDWATSIDPQYLADSAVQRIQSGLADGPVFMMFHLVPPHSPYTPPTEHRQWSAPGYEGPCDGSINYLNSIRGRQDTVSPQDFQELLALYDGNMRFCDAAVERIFEALNEVGRFENSLILVTSDHGEAFFEHGKLDHNSTVYQEMLHVPFVLRLPGGDRPAGIDLDRLASLEDLTPTVLAFAGVQPESRQTGLDLFSERRRRSILHRSATQQNIQAFRYGRWKLISDRRGVVTELYDLENDPGEQKNMLVARPDVVSWIIGAWQATRDAVPEPLVSGEREITDEDREMLEQLGYLSD